MAKIKFGMFMTDARGKVGGQVFSKNRSGAYVKNKSTPTNGQTLRQTFIRQLLGAISQAWSALSISNRASFNNAVESWSKTDIFGDARNPTGKNLFTALNLNLVNSGQAQITSAPEKVEMPVLSVTSVTNSGTVLTVVADDDLPEGQVIVMATAPQTLGTSYFKGKFRQIGVIAGTAIDAADITSLYVAKFGSFASGANIAFEFRVILDNGQAGVPVIVKAV